MVYEKICEIVSETTGKDVSEISMETNFKDFDIDSLDLFQIINDVEDHYDIRIEDIENFTTVGEFVKYVEAQVK